MSIISKGYQIQQYFYILVINNWILLLNYYFKLLQKMKFADINLIKHMLDLHADSYKILKKQK